MPKKPDSQIIRLGDVVEVVGEVRPVVRVGYSLVWHEINVGHIADFLGLRFEKYRDLKNSFRSMKAAEDFENGLRRAIVQELGFGGSDRKVIRHCSRLVEPGLYDVIEKRVAKTGIHCSNGGEYCSLDNVKTHIVLSIARVNKIEKPVQVLSTDVVKVRSYRP
jgi:hypothetical protein